MITTKNVNGRDDWFSATGEHNGRVYTEFSKTRQAAFLEVLRRIWLASGRYSV